MGSVTFLATLLGHKRFQESILIAGNSPLIQIDRLLLYRISTCEYVVTSVKISDQPDQVIWSGDQVIRWYEISLLRETDLKPILEKEIGPGFCLIAALQFLLKKAEDEKSHIVLNSLQIRVILVIIMMKGGQCWWWYINYDEVFLLICFATPPLLGK